MPTFRVECDGLTLKECRELAEAIQTQSGVERVSVEVPEHGLAPGSINASAAGAIALAVKLAEVGGKGMAFGIGNAAAHHAYDKVGKAIVDGAWDWMKSRLTGKRELPVEITLYDSEGNRIKSLKGKR